jgi:hypothetical protein
LKNYCRHGAFNEKGSSDANERAKQTVSQAKVFAPVNLTFDIR